MSEHVRIDKSGGVLTLTLDRPEKKNALTRVMYQALGEAIDGAEHDPQVRCVLIQAEGDAFTAGNDLADFVAVNAGGANAEVARVEGNPLLAALTRAKTPLVAAVQGRAVGIGVTMLLHCDLVYVAEEAILSTPFVNLALVPEAASSLLLPARIGHARAFAMFVLGETIDGRTAAAWGLANAALPVGEVQARARAAAEAVARQMAQEGAHFLDQLKSPEAREAFMAFAEKRAPDFSKVA